MTGPTKLLSKPSVPSRRSVIAGLLSAAAPAPALALACHGQNEVFGHPDQALLDAETELQRLTDIAKEADRASDLASDCMWKALGRCPDELILSQDELGTYVNPMRRRCVGNIRLQWVRDDGDGWGPQAWTAPDLRTAISTAVDVHGRAGRTPHTIRRYRALLPIAEDFDRRRRECEDRFWVKELSDARRDAENARSLAERRLNAFTASTLDGLAVITRHVGTFGWEKMPSAWISLLLSAAEITGTDLGIPDFDVRRWASELEAVGGRICRPSRYSTGGIQYPVDDTHSMEVRETIARLSQEHQDHKIQIRLFVERDGVAA